MRKAGSELQPSAKGSLSPGSQLLQSFLATHFVILYYSSPRNLILCLKLLIENSTNKQCLLLLTSVLAARCCSATQPRALSLDRAGTQGLSPTHIYRVRASKVDSQ